MSGGGMLISDKYELIAQTSYAGQNDYRYSYEEVVSLYRLQSTAAGVITWDNLQDRPLPKGATQLLTSATLAAIAFLLF